MNKKQLVIKATELGIENAEALTVPQLKLAIENSEKVITDNEALKVKASELGIEITEDSTEESLGNAIIEAEVKEKEYLENEIFKEKNQILVDFFGISNFEELTPETLKETLAATMNSTAAEIEVVEDSGKTDKTYTTPNGIEYAFTEKAPSRFRFMDVVRTQKEWISDEEAMDLMVSGNLSFVKPLKK